MTFNPYGRPDGYKKAPRCGGIGAQYLRVILSLFFGGFCFGCKSLGCYLYVESLRVEKVGKAI